MTNEEARNILKSLKEYYNDKNKDGYVGFDDEDNEVLDMAIKTLEQEPILDKIRAEIVDLAQRTMNDNRAGGMWTCIDIIDKYKIESEDEK